MKKKSGFVYFGESTRKNGDKKIYTGMTRRPVRTRWGEHIKAAKFNTRRGWTGKGAGFKPMGAFFSRNPAKAEKTIKKLKPYQKRYLVRGAAMRFKRKKK